VIQAMASIARAQTATLESVGACLRINQRSHDRIHCPGLSASKAYGMVETKLESVRKGDLGTGG
jgi:hypothetical protein